MEVIHNINIDLGKNELIPNLSFMQNDSARKIIVTLYQNTVSWYVPDGASAYIAFTNPNGENIKMVTLSNGNPVVTIEYNVLTVNVPPELTAKAGKIPFVIVLLSGIGEQIATFPISVSILENPATNGKDAEVVSPDQFDQLMGALAIERARINNLAKLKEGSTTADAELVDIRVSYDGLTYPNAGSAIRGQIKKLSGRIEEIVSTKGGDGVLNLFDKDSPNILKNYFLGSSMDSFTTYTEVPLDKYGISDFIPVEEGKQYTTNRDGVGFNIGTGSDPNKISFWYFDENKEPLARPRGVFTEGSEIYTSVAPIGAKYAKIDFFLSTADKIMFVEGDVFPDEYVAYDPEGLQKVIRLPLSKEQEQKLTKAIIDAINTAESAKDYFNPLFGKTAVFAGDSICEGYNFGDTEDAYAGRVANKNNMTYKNFGVSGTTLTEKLAYRSDTGAEKPSISYKIDEMYAEYPNADYIIIEGGTNDADLMGSRLNGEIPERFGTFTVNDFSGNYDRETFCGALESILYRATQYWKGKKIGYIVAHKMGINKPGYTAEKHNRRAYFETAIQICNKWGVFVLNLWDDCLLNPSLPNMYTPGITWEENANLGSLYADGQHLLPAGYDYIADIIDNWLKSMSISSKGVDLNTKERLSALEAGYRHIKTITQDTDEAITQIEFTADVDDKPFSCSEFLIFLTLPTSAEIEENYRTQLYVGVKSYPYDAYIRNGFSLTATRLWRMHLKHLYDGYWALDGTYTDNENTYYADINCTCGSIKSPAASSEKANSLYFRTAAAIPNGAIFEVYGR